MYTIIWLHPYMKGFLKPFAPWESRVTAATGAATSSTCDPKKPPKRAAKGEPPASRGLESLADNIKHWCQNEWINHKSMARGWYSMWVSKWANSIWAMPNHKDNIVRWDQFGSAELILVCKTKRICYFAIMAVSQYHAPQLFTSWPCCSVKPLRCEVLKRTLQTAWLKCSAFSSTIEKMFCYHGTSEKRLGLISWFDLIPLRAKRFFCSTMVCYLLHEPLAIPTNPSNTSMAKSYTA